MRLLTLLLFLAVIVLISNASPPKKRVARKAVSAPKRPFKSTAGRKNSVAARAFSGSKKAKNKQFKKATGVKNRRSLPKRNGSGSSNNGKARRAAAAKSRVVSNSSRTNPANNKRRGPGSRNRNRLANRPPLVDIPDDTLLDDEQYLDELPDNDLSFELSEYNNPLGNNRRGQKSSSNRTFARSNDKLKLALEDKKPIANLSDAQFNEMLKNIGEDIDSVEDIDNVEDGKQQKEVTEVKKPPVELRADKSSVEKNIDYNDEKDGLHSDEAVADESFREVEKPIDEKDGIDSDDIVADESSRGVEKPSAESSATKPTEKISDEKDYDFEDLNEEELSEGDSEEDDKKL